MRIAYCLMLAAVLLSSGCAGLISTKCGKDLTPLKTRQEVQAEFGEPAASGLADGLPFEEYRTRIPIAQPFNLKYNSPGYAMVWLGTFGAIDLLLVPRELYLASKRILLGQTIRVTYDTSGSVNGIYREGEPLNSMFGTTVRPSDPQGTEKQQSARQDSQSP